MKGDEFRPENQSLTIKRLTFDLRAINMAIETLELVQRNIDYIVISNPSVRINHRAKPDLGIYAEVPPWITLERSTPPYEEKISPEGWPPEYLNVVGQEWAYKCPNLWLLVQYMHDPYHKKYSHLGEFVPHGWSGSDETRTVRGFEISLDQHGKDQVSFHWFIRDRRQLLAVYQGIPERVVDSLFISPRR